MADHIRHYESFLKDVFLNHCAAENSNGFIDYTWYVWFVRWWCDFLWGVQKVCHQLLGQIKKKINLYNQLDFILDISILRLPGGQDKMLTFNISSLWWPKPVIEDTISLSSRVGGAHVQELPKILKLLQTKTSRWKLHLSWIWPVSFVCSPGAQ